MAVVARVCFTLFSRNNGSKHAFKTLTIKSAPRETMAGPASERDSGTRKPHSKRVKEHVVRDALSRRLGAKAMIEVLTPAGSIDVLSEHEVIEVKHYS